MESDCDIQIVSTAEQIGQPKLVDTNQIEHDLREVSDILGALYHDAHQCFDGYDPNNPEVD